MYFRSGVRFSFLVAGRADVCLSSFIKLEGGKCLSIVLGQTCVLVHLLG